MFLEIESPIYERLDGLGSSKEREGTEAEERVLGKNFGKIDGVNLRDH
jgi:hypothetical protein